LRENPAQQAQEQREKAIRPLAPVRQGGALCGRHPECIQENQDAIPRLRVGDQPGQEDGVDMVAVTVPLFEKPLYTEIERAKVEVKKERFRLAKSSQELSAKAEALRASLPLYERSEALARKSVESQKKLLEYARVAFDTGRIIEEEYLRYEEKLLDAQSRTLEARAKYWQALAELAVLYGNDLSELVE
jgi:outer membrane protein TolC